MSLGRCIDKFHSRRSAQLGRQTDKPVKTAVILHQLGDDEREDVDIGNKLVKKGGVVHLSQTTTAYARTSYLA